MGTVIPLRNGINEVKPTTHRRRMETEAKAKVGAVASVWGADLVKFLAALAVLPRSIWKNIG